MEAGVYGVHLRQEDLVTADISVIHAANLRLGISTHSLYELACAHAFPPSYIAFKPIYETTIKTMTFHLMD
ncbi:thiamine phosphate synthase [Coxiella-like endosymbiont of Rhipicephalus sanguineus]|uniref:thiamine phosphate synthase n=1 Tax=Coxiella-like endosymbiont of Rhipicephalus sanguineus TaxID=1955402 RepID=UPI002040B1A8|nr:thiamine phosphate synthase [Coxiella-like endosymbiont of Rhipicephalus sanguineus]